MLVQTYLTQQERLRTFQTNISQIKEFGWKQALQRGCQKYNVNAFNIKKLTPQKVYAIYLRIHEKFYVVQRFKNNTWLENELRVFIWMLIVNSQRKNTSPENFSQQDWKFFVNIFQGKSIQILKFQYKSIINKKMIPWNQQQDKLLQSLLHEKTENNSNWNEISRQFFKLSDQKYFKTPKQCRQHWNNYLNPKILKSKWSSKQDYLLMKHVIEKGRQWATISKILDSTRTQHMVKNRFKSLVLSHSKEFNISKKISQSFPILQKIYLKIKSDFEQGQQLNILKQQQYIQQEPAIQVIPQKNEYTIVATPNQSTTIGIRSPSYLSPFAFSFSPNPIMHTFMIPVFNNQSIQNADNPFSFPRFQGNYN